MRIFLIAFLVGGQLVTIAAQAVADEPPLDETVAHAVRDFTPPWTPPRGELAGLSIGVHAAAGTEGAAAAAADDWSLMTANHLWHMVRRGGARIVPSHRDTTRGRRDAEIASDWLARVRESKCDACVLIVCGTPNTTGDIRVAAAGNRDISRRLAAAIAEEYHTEAARATDGSWPLLDELGAIETAACVVTLAPPKSTELDVAARKSAHEHARHIYRALRSVLQPKPGESDEPPPDEARDPRRRARLEQLARSIWPAGELPAERVEWFCGRLAEAAITNRTLVYFAVETAVGEDGINLTVRTNAPRIARELALAVRRVTSAAVALHVVALPDSARLGTEPFGVCRAPAALTYAQPNGTGPVQTQLTFGEPLRLLDRADDHFLVQARDGYWGWVHADAVETATSEQFGALLDSPRAIVTRPIDLGELRVPSGARLPLVGVAGEVCTVLLPGGRREAVPASAALATGRDRAAAAQRVRDALALLYTPYVFGGRSCLGMDCSGLLTLVAAREGVTPARDAWQQALAGELVATHGDRGHIRAGDQLYFMNSSGKVYHTGLAISATCLVHAAPPCVQINSLDPQHPLYDAVLDRDLFVVKRP